MVMDLNDAKTRQLCDVIPIRATNIVFTIVSQVLRENHKQYSSTIQFHGKMSYGMINPVSQYLIRCKDGSSVTLQCHPTDDLIGVTIRTAEHASDGMHRIYLHSAVYFNMSFSKYPFRKAIKLVDDCNEWLDNVHTTIKCILALCMTESLADVRTQLLDAIAERESVDKEDRFVIEIDHIEADGKAVFKGSFMKPKKKSYMDAFFKTQEL